ncbi:MAG: hypothetical protein WAW10_12250 [Gallionella sp.]
MLASEKMFRDGIISILLSQYRTTRARLSRCKLQAEMFSRIGEMIIKNAVYLIGSVVGRKIIRGAPGSLPVNRS